MDCPACRRAFFVRVCEALVGWEGRNSKKPPKKVPAEGPSRRPEGGGRAKHKGGTSQGRIRQGQSRGEQAGMAGWLHGKRPVFRFVVSFGLLMGLFYLAGATSFANDTVFPKYLRLNARLSGAILRVFEDSVTVSGESLSSPRYSLTIARGCDAIEPSALFLAGVLAFPAPLLSKLPGMLIGTLCLMVLNLVRIVTLFYVGVFWPRAFHTVHVDVWQALFIFLAILFWTLWALRASRPGTLKPDAADSSR